MDKNSHNLPILAVLAVLLATLCGCISGGTSSAPTRAVAEKAYRAGEYEKAYGLFVRLLKSDSEDGESAGNDIAKALRALERLRDGGVIDQKTFDEREDALLDDLSDRLEQWKNDWRFLAVCGTSDEYCETDSIYVRGTLAVYLQESFYRMALPTLPKDGDEAFRARFFDAFSSSVSGWYFLDLFTWGERADDWTYPNECSYSLAHGGTLREISVPDSYEDGRNRLERWLWCRGKLMECVPQSGRDAALLQTANGLYGHLGEWPLVAPQLRDYREPSKRISDNCFSMLRSLGDDETLLKYDEDDYRAVHLPDIVNYMKIYRELASWGNAEAMMRLGMVYENRQCSDEALEWYAKARAASQDKRLSELLDRHLIPHLSKPSLSISPQSTIVAGKPSRLPFYCRNVGSLQFRLSRLRSGDIVDAICRRGDELGAMTVHKLFASSSMGGIGLSNVLPFDASVHLEGEALKWKMEIAKDGDCTDHAERISLPPLPPGFHRLTARLDDGTEIVKDILCYDTYIIRMEAYPRPTFQLVDSVNGKPLMGVSATFFLKENQNPLRQIKQQSGKDGLIAIDDAQAPLGWNWKWIVAIVDDGKHFAVTPPLASNRYNGDDDLRADAPSRACSSFVVTDRPFYAPGDTVFFTAWLAALNDFRPFADSDCTAILIGMDRKELLSTKLKTDAAGVASGSFILPSDLDTDSCRIRIKADAVMFDVFSPSFTVGKNAPPETMLHFQPVAEPLVAGDDFDVRIHASCIAGKSAAGRKVNCSVRIVESIDTDRFDSNDGDDDDDDDFDSYDGTPLYDNGNSTYEPSWYPAWKTLHADTVAIHRRMSPVSRDYEIELDGSGDGRIHINTSQIIKEHGRRDLFVALKAELADCAGGSIGDSMNLFLLDRAYKVQLHPAATYAVVGEPFAVGVEVTTFGMEPLPANGRLRLLKVVCGDDGSITEKPLPWQEFKTDMDGKTVVMVVPPEAGHYRVLAEVETAGKGKGACSDMILAWKESEQLNSERFNGVELHLDKAEYNVGDVARLLVCNDRADIPVFLIKYICGKPQPIETVEISGKCAVVVFTVTKEMAFGAGIAAYSPTPDNKCETAAVAIKTSFGRPLSMKLTTLKSEMRPGETAEVSIELSDSNGKPVEANIVVAVHDASIDCLDNKATTSLHAAMNHFSAERKYAFPNEWKYTAIQNSLWKAFPRGNYSKAGIPPDFFQMTLSEHEDFGRDLEKFRMQDTEFDTVPSTAEAFCRKRKISIFRRDKPPHIEWRSEFHGTAFWKADIKTDAAGKAVVSFKLPAAATWRIDAWAATDDARYGDNTAYIYCNQ